MSLFLPSLSVQAPRALSGTGTTQGPQVGIATGGDWVALHINTTTVTGTGSPTMALKVQWTVDGGTTWADADTADTFTSVTATGAVVKRFSIKGSGFRVVETLTGTTPAFTYTLSVYTG